MAKSNKDQLIHKLDVLEKRTVTLLDNLQIYEDDDLTSQPSPDVWSVNQVLTHLMLSERVSLQYVRKKLSFDPLLRRSDFMARVRSQLLRLALLLPFKFKAPKGVQIEGKLRQKSFHVLREEWLADRDQLKMYLLNLNEELLDLQVYKHPFAGRLSLIQMVDFFINHLRRHEGQIHSRLP